MECLKLLCLVEVSMMFIQVHTDTLKISNILVVETASVEFSLHLGVGKAFGYFTHFQIVRGNASPYIVFMLTEDFEVFDDNSHISSDFPMPMEFP